MVPIQYVSNPSWSIILRPKWTLRSELFFSPRRGVLKIAAFYASINFGLWLVLGAVEKNDSQGLSILRLFDFQEFNGDRIFYGLVLLPLVWAISCCYLYIVAFLTLLVSRLLGLYLTLNPIKHIIALSLIPYLCATILLLLFAYLLKNASQAAVVTTMWDRAIYLALVVIPIVWAGYIHWQGFYFLCGRKVKSLILISASLMPYLASVFYSITP